MRLVEYSAAKTSITAHRVVAIDLAESERGWRDQLRETLRQFARRQRRIILVLHGNTYRSQTEFLPPARDRFARLALQRRVECGPGEFAKFVNMGATQRSEVSNNCWQAWVVRESPLLEVLEVLDGLRIRVRATVTEEALFEEAACRGCATADLAGDAAFIAVRPLEMNLAFISDGKVRLTRRKALAGDDASRRTIASETQRTAVYFHRKFPDYRVTKAALQCDGDGLEGLAEDIRASCRFKEVVPIGGCLITVTEDATGVPFDPLPLSWLGGVDGRRLRRRHDLEPPSRRRARTVRRVGIAIAGLVVVLCSLAATYLLSLQSVADQLRTLVAGYRADLAAAQQTIASWDEAQSERKRLLARIRRFTELEASNIDLARVLSEVAAVIPDDVVIEGFRIARAPGGEPSGKDWFGRIAFRCPVGYLWADDRIAATRRALARASFLESAHLEVSVPKASLPWSGAKRSLSDTCRFHVSFSGAGT